MDNKKITIADVFTDDLINKVNNGEVQCRIGTYDDHCVIQTIEIDEENEQVACFFHGDDMYAEPFLFVMKNEVGFDANNAFTINEETYGDDVQLVFFQTTPYNIKPIDK